MANVCPICQSKVPEGSSSCPACNFNMNVVTQAFKPVTANNDVDTDGPSELKASMRMVRGPQVGAVYPLDKDVISIGRNPQSDIFLNDMTVSREHADITRHADSLIINDHHSFNGVWINNKTVESHVLRPGDYIQIGKYDFVYEEDENGR